MARMGMRGIFLALLLTLAFHVSAVDHVFKYDASKDDPKPKSVAVAGDFNDWSTTANALTDDGQGVFTGHVDLSEGTHQYKFVVSGDKWINDPKADKKLEQDDNFGGKNSVVKIEAGSGDSGKKDAKAGDESAGHLFKFDASKVSPKPEHVYLAGDFNGWSANTMEMKDDGNGTYSVRVPLSEGVHFYKFVINGTQWVNDPNDDKKLRESDGNGGMNSAVFIGPDARKLPPPEKGNVRGEAVHHDPSSMADLDVVSPTVVRFSIRVQANDVDSANVMVEDGSGMWEKHRLEKVDTAFNLDRYTGLVEVEKKPIRYVFEFTDSGRSFFYSSGGLHAFVDSATAKPYLCDGVCRFETPEWAKHAVWYQIFPERFRNGDTANDPAHTVRWQCKWFETQPGEVAGAENFYQGAGNIWHRRYGGDIQGIREELPYLRKLGINAIYLNPIFKAESLHKYDTSDYRHVDDTFGFKGDITELTGETEDPATWQWTKTDKLFLDFVAEAHRQGFRVILDGVFNHVGRDFWAFQDVMKNGRASKYANWFEITDFGSPMHYKAWDKPDGDLPVFKKSAATGLVDGPRQHILAIAKRWLAPDGDASRGVDGFRLDVPGDVPSPFWVEFRKLVKSAKADAYITGEIWPWAQPWLKGDQFDAVMNYRFATAAQGFFVDQKKANRPSEFGNALNEIVNAYPFQSALVLQNLFDSHDTDRFASMFMNPDLGYDNANRLQDSGPHYNIARPTPEDYVRMRQAVVCQMTFAGAPMIYYGDEAGMWSADDPADRQPMVWKDKEPFDDPQVKFDDVQFAHYQRAIAIHRALPALQTGYFRVVEANDKAGTIAYERTMSGHDVYVVLNRSKTRQAVRVPVGSSSQMIDYMNTKSVEVVESGDRPEVRVSDHARTITPVNGAVTVTLDPYQSAILCGKGN